MKLNLINTYYYNNEIIFFFFVQYLNITYKFLIIFDILLLLIEFYTKWYLKSIQYKLN